MRTITVGIDVGTFATKIAVAEFIPGEGAARIIGTGVAPGMGMRRGYISNKADAILALKRAKIEAEKAANVPIKRAILSISAGSIGSIMTAGQCVISRADSEVTALDIEKAHADSESGVDLTNRHILHSVPLFYKLDGKEMLDEPEGMKGAKLETKTLSIVVLERHFETLAEIVAQAGIDVIDIVFAPIAEAEITLVEKQKIAGSVLIDIGAETVSMAVFENGGIIYAAVFPLGGTDITNDIALGFQTSLEEAEGLKIGSVFGNYPKKKLDEIINARLVDIFELVDNHLKKIKRSGLLPAGAFITGGGSQIAGIEEVAKLILKLPARVGTPEYFNATKNRIKDASWFAAYGLAVMGSGKWNAKESSGFGDFWKNIKKSVGSIVKQLMP